MLSNHIIICGLGHVGFRVFELFKALNEKCVIISDRILPEWQNIIEQSGAQIILGDARDEKLLLLAGIKKAKSILVVTDVDIANLSIAADAKTLNPDIRVILRLFDTEVGKFVSESLKIDRIFSASAIAAPIFVSGAIGDKHLGHMEDANKTYVLLEESYQKWSESQLEYEKPILYSVDSQVLFEDNKEKQLEKVLVIQELENEKLEEERESFLSRLKKKMDMVPPRIGILFCSLIFIVLGSAALIHNQMNVSWMDSIYFSVSTITTVGYGDFNFSQAPFIMKIFGCLLMLSGCAILAITFGIMTDLLISEKLKKFISQTPPPSSNHNIVVGSGNIAKRIVDELLRLNKKVLLINDGKYSVFSEDVKRRVGWVAGNPRNIETLEAAQLQSADSILVVTEDDIENLGIGLTAKKIKPDIHVAISIFDTNLGRKLQNRLKLDRVLSSSTLTASYFVAASYDPNVLLSLVWKKHLILISKASGNGGDFQVKALKLNDF